MNQIGNLDRDVPGKCFQLGLTTPLEMVEFSKSNERGIDAMILTKDGENRTYGEFGSNFVKYQFTDDEPLIGLSAYQSDDKINQIAIYTVNIDCAATTPEEVEEPKKEV